jgi:tetratricopeptide (TPR) repeat protein
MLEVRKANELDVVELLEDLPDYGLKKGERGTVVEVFDNPEEAYMIEFTDESGTESKIADWVHPHQVENVNAQAATFFNAGVQLLQQGRFVEAAKEIREAVRIRPNLIRVLHELFCDNLAERELWDQVIEGMQFIININPKYDLAKLNLAIAYLNYGVKKVEERDLKEELNLFLMAFRMETPANVAELVKKNIATAHTMLGIQAYREDEKKDAVKHMESAYMFDSNSETRRRLGLAYSSIAETYLFDKDFNNAVMNYVLAEQTGMLTSENLNNRAVAHVHLGEIDEAVLALESALTIDPINEVAQKNLELLKRVSPFSNEN